MVGRTGKCQRCQNIIIERDLIAWLSVNWIKQVRQNHCSSHVGCPLQGGRECSEKSRIKLEDRPGYRNDKYNFCRSSAQAAELRLFIKLCHDFFAVDFLFIKLNSCVFFIHSYLLYLNAMLKVSLHSTVQEFNRSEGRNPQRCLFLHRNVRRRDEPR